MYARPGSVTQVLLLSAFTDGETESQNCSVTCQAPVIWKWHSLDSALAF